MKTRPSKQCKSLINVLILRQYLEKIFFVEDTVRDLANESQRENLSSWLNSALQDDELYKVIPDGTWWKWVGIGGNG